MGEVVGGIVVNFHARGCGYKSRSVGSSSAGSRGWIGSGKLELQ